MAGPRFDIRRGDFDGGGMADPRSVLLVDGENIDWALSDLLGRKPGPEQRPRWDRLVEFAREKFEGPCRPLFFVNTTGGIAQPFIAALRHLGYTPVMLVNDLGPEVKVVDYAIEKTLQALQGHPGLAVLLASHDKDFYPALKELQDGRALGVIGFPELMQSVYHDDEGLQLYDLEHDVGAFNVEAFEGGMLPRHAPVRLSRFDPRQFLALGSSFGGHE